MTPPGESGREHSIVFSFDKYGMSSKMTCPFDPADESRPCWPHTEYGERYSPQDGAQDGCTWESWYGETGDELIVGGPDLTVPVASCDWRMDYPEFTLGPAPSGGSDGVGSNP